MAHDIQTMLGYHGNEIRFYDELLGGKGQWRYAGNPNLLDLLGRPLPAAARGAGGARLPPGARPCDDHAGLAGILLERDTTPPYVRVDSPAPPSCPRTRSCRP